ncbi:MAG: 4-hydroxy-3-methylbut-2-enyl diphosphate reductase [Gemmatimonadota bacterium]
MSSTPAETYFRKGFGLASEVRSTLESDYAGDLVTLMRAGGNALTRGDVTVHLAKEFGFCYGVERAVEYAYQARRKFPERRIHLLGEIIHNPHVNETLQRMGIEILAPAASAGADQPRFSYDAIGKEDVVILPAFGVTIVDFEALRAHGCVVVDTTCGSVLNVWKRVESYARDAFTSIIHGKYYHEETRATASQVLRYPGGAYMIVRNASEAGFICRQIAAIAAGGMSGDEHATFNGNFAHAVSPGFDPELQLRRIGVANQTTMLARESLAIGEQIRTAMVEAFGSEYAAANFRTFDTICSATQDRQDAVNELLEIELDAMIVVGGFNSSNTISLAAICARHVPTFHVEDPSAIDPLAGTVFHRPARLHHSTATARGWMPSTGPARIGITAGASTPNNKVGEAIVRIFATRGIDLAAPEQASPGPGS